MENVVDWKVNGKVDMETSQKIQFWKETTTKMLHGLLHPGVKQLKHGLDSNLHSNIQRTFEIEFPEEKLISEG